MSGAPRAIVPTTFKVVDLELPGIACHTGECEAQRQYMAQIEVDLLAPTLLGKIDEGQRDGRPARGGRHIDTEQIVISDLGSFDAHAMRAPLISVRNTGILAKIVRCGGGTNRCSEAKVRRVCVSPLIETVRDLE